MAFSYIDYVANGVNTDFTFPFPYIDESHVRVTVNNVVPSFIFLNESTIRISPAPTAGAAIKIQRNTPIGTAPVDFQDGSVLRESDLDTAVLYNLYIVQELFDLYELQQTLDPESALLLNYAAFNYDIAIQIPYTPDNSEVLTNLVMTSNIKLGVNMDGSTGYSQVAPVGQSAVFSVRRNGIEVGTITFAVGSQIASFSMLTETVWAIGDRLDIVAPTNVPLGFKGIGIILRARRTVV